MTPLQTLERTVLLLVIAIAVGGLRALAQTTASANGALARSYDPQLPNVVVLETGAPAARDAARDRSARVDEPQLGAERLIAAVPRTSRLANLRVERIASVAPHDVNDAVWIGLATRVDELLAMPDVTGVVVVHPFDAIEETAYFLNLVVKSDKPVVVTTAARPSGAESSSASGEVGFYDAVAVAATASAYARGVLIVLDDSVRAASDFAGPSTGGHFAGSPRSAVTGLVSRDTVVWYGAASGKHGARSEFSVDDTTTLPRVDIIAATRNMDPTLIDAAVASGAKGIVIATTEHETIPEAALHALAAQAKRGIVCVRARRAATGQAGPDVAVDDDAAGLVSSLAIDPGKARVLLRVALLNTRDPRRIQQYFASY